jgi:sodium transport system permease protein
MVPLVGFVSALQIFISITAKSYKEGQTYMTMLSFLPALAGYLVIFSEDKLGNIVSYLPIFTDMKSLQSILVDGVFNQQLAVTALVLSLVGAGVCLYLSERRLGHESMTTAG